MYLQGWVQRYVFPLCAEQLVSLWRQSRPPFFVVDLNYVARLELQQSKAGNAFSCWCLDPCRQLPFISAQKCRLSSLQIKQYLYCCVTQACIFLCAIACTCRISNTVVTLLKKKRRAQTSASSLQHFAFSVLYCNDFTFSLLCKD